MSSIVASACDRAPITSAASEDDNTLRVSSFKSVFINLGEGSWIGINAPLVRARVTWRILTSNTRLFNRVDSQLLKDIDHLADYTHVPVSVNVAAYQPQPS